MTAREASDLVAEAINSRSPRALDAARKALIDSGHPFVRVAVGTKEFVVEAVHPMGWRVAVQRHSVATSGLPDSVLGIASERNP